MVWRLPPTKFPITRLPGLGRAATPFDFVRPILPVAKYLKGKRRSGCQTVKKTNVHENSYSFKNRMQLAFGGVLFLAVIALRHYWEYLIAPIVVGLTAIWNDGKAFALRVD
jgi:hypothetical protein